MHAKILNCNCYAMVFDCELPCLPVIVQAERHDNQPTMQYMSSLHLLCSGVIIIKKKHGFYTTLIRVESNARESEQELMASLFPHVLLCGSVISQLL